MNFRQRLGTAINVLFGQKEVVPTDVFRAWIQTWEEKQGLAMSGDPAEMINNFHSWIYACIMKIAGTVAAQKLRLYVKRGDKREEIIEHPFLDLIKNVNPFENGFETTEKSFMYLELTGNNYTYIASDRLGIPREMWIMPAQNMKIIPSATDFISGYKYTEAGKTITFEPEEILHEKYPNPKDKYYGFGPLMAAAYATDTLLYMKKHERALFLNRARPEAILKTEQALTKQQRDRMREGWNEKFQGVEKTGKLAILEKGLDYKPITMSQKELDFLEGGKANKEEISTIFGVPFGILGVVVDVNRANQEGLMLQFMRDTIRPKLKRREEKLNEKILPRYDKKLVCEYDDPVPQDKEFRLKEKESNLKNFVTTVNEAREQAGLKPVPWGNVPIGPINMMPITSEPVKTSIAGSGKFLKDVEAERRARKFQVFLAAQAPQERLFIKVLEEYFTVQRNKVLRNLRNFPKSIEKINIGELDHIYVPMELAISEYAKKTDKFYKEMLKAGELSGLSDLGIDLTIPPNIETAYLGEKIKVAGTEINKTTRKMLEKQFIEGIENGESVTELANRVKGVYELRNNNALRIARTESCDVVNEGRLLGWEESGVVDKKEWLAAGDCCDDCAVIDGQAVGLRDYFDTPFGALNAPSAHPNCRCTIEEILKQEV